ncbi:HAD family hydrolase [Acidithiobacillus thiooxidans]|uniref:Haloacid dehalogenase n=1 Tax=Acidithiobacillus thiooxidans ATCC 19377 TaxID=637390 RepID=A0A543Q1T1_ACITH|nr:HAD family hydrolase [Acidithiobacillus thiooxidans]MDX5935561.1 HAD family hydrolase [Acidithiobacillus thiooxidans]TQN50296.1 hypothetical protein DLNHIDIE_00149 [Acidithiobacillus thiooxidans ATCC 19377]
MIISRQHKPPVVLDVDGVLLNFEQAWKQCAEETLQHAVIRKENTWDLATRFGLPSENVRQVWDAFHADGWFGRIDPYPYAWELVGALKAMGCEVFAITNVDPAFFRERALTLGDLIPEKNLQLLGAKASPEQRLSVLRALGARAFLDDRVGNVNLAAFHVPVSAWLCQGYQDADAPADGVTVLDAALDFPLLLESMLP